MLKQECGWFDDNSAGALTNRLSDDAADIQTVDIFNKKMKKTLFYQIFSNRFKPNRFTFCRPLDIHSV